MLFGQSYVGHSFSSKEQVSFNFMAAVTTSSDFGAEKKINSLTVSIILSSICHGGMGPMPWSLFSECWALSQLFHSPHSLSSRDSSSSSLSAIRVVSSAYLRLLIFLPAILIPACALFSLTFLMMYSAYKLNKQDDNIQPWCTPFPIWNQSVVPCEVLTVASWPAYRFLKRQVRWSDILISFRIFYSLLWSTQSKALA